MKEKKNLPQKGAGRKWSEKLKERGDRHLPQEIADRLNKDDYKKIATPRRKTNDLDIR